MRRPLWSIVAIVVALCVFQGKDFAQAPSESAIPIDIDVPLAPTAVRAEGKWHLFYEVHLTNFRRGTLELTRVEVHTGDASEQLVASYTGQDLSDRLLRPGASSDTADKRIIQAGLRAVVLLHLTLNAQGATPTTLWHRLVFKSTSVDAGEDAVRGGRIEVSKTSPLAIGPPLRGGDWLAANGPSNGSEHRLALIAVNGKARIAQRFAIDWVKLGSDGKLAHDDPSSNTNWYGYGSEVLAVADGTVVATKDGIPENVPLTDKFAVPITLETIGGNYVILDLNGTRHAMFGHLQPNSLRVTVGRRVRRGQVLGLLGNSGNSDAPHLHFQITDGNSPLGSEGLPFVFDSFRLGGTVTSLGSVLRGEAWTPQAPAVARTEEMPLDNAVIRFP
jgi:hypothetical protein